jgi:hypothetical protein
VSIKFIRNAFGKVDFEKFICAMRYWSTSRRFWAQKIDRSSLKEIDHSIGKGAAKTDDISELAIVPSAVGTSECSDG